MEEDKGKAKLADLREIERRHQQRWNEVNIYEADPDATPDDKFFATFPYPYMNGRLHMGHVFAFSKAEFYARFQRLQGKHTLLPLAFHATGMPISAAADKLKYEMATFGTPPQFPAEPTAAEAEESGAETALKSKTLMKQGKQKYQWKILESMGVPAEIIPKFANAEFWLTYFPALGQQDLQAWGACVDWRRSFVTTEMNPYYDSFVRWQYNTLKAQDRFVFGKRFAIFAPQQNQPCADHERSAGEGVQPQDYTLIKMRVLEVPETIREIVGSRTLFMVAGTMRPETMVGQTNCWIKPDGDYGIFEIDANTLFICSDKSARNMSYQENSVEFGKTVLVGRINGADLIGTPVSSPMCTYERIYALPMDSVLMTKATGVVTSVPSDAPDDWQNLLDLKNDAELRAKYNVKDEWLMPFKPVPIIDTPELGELAAETVCIAEKVKSRHDAAALKKAKATAYLHGFHSGIMKTTKYAGQTVEAAKSLIRDDLIAAGDAVAYSEPAETVVSRSGEECVVALTDQWSITYGDPAWRDPVLEHVKSDDFESFGQECRTNLEACLNWMAPWAVSRTYGMGTKLPWDEQFLIESLSDSTIYMAYYTIAHYLQSDLYGKAVGTANISAAEMTHAVWDYIFLSKPFPADASVSAEMKTSLDKMSAEFNYWYPWDIRCSGRDLLQNHLTMTLYHHAAIFPKKHWPKGIRANGFMMLNEEKMSKSTGNFLTLTEGIEKFGCDAMRLNLARGGDQMTDGNFNEHEADQTILTLHSLLTSSREAIASRSTQRSGDFNFFDELIDLHITNALESARQEFQRSNFRAGVEVGFTALLLQWKTYLSSVGDLGLAIGPHESLVQSFVRAMAILLASICPHLAEELWTLSGGEGFVVSARWPDAKSSHSKVLVRQESYFETLCSEVRRRQKLEKNADKVTTAQVFISGGAPEWQTRLVEIVNGADRDLDRGGIMKLIAQDKVASSGGKAAKKIIPGLVQKTLAARDGGPGAEAEESFDELEFLTRLHELLEKKVGLKVVLYVHGAEGAPPCKAKVSPQSPGVVFIQ